MSLPCNPPNALRIALLCLLFTAPLSRPALADWAGFGTYAALIQANLEENSITVELRLHDTGLARLRERLGLAPDAGFPALAVRLPDLAVDGKSLPIPAGMDIKRETSAPASNEAYFEAKMRYPLSRPPALLSLTAPVGTGQDIGFVLLHRGVPVNDLAPLAKPARLRPDWKHPWNSRFDDPTLVRRHSEPRSYIYVEPYEVRHELLLRLADLLPTLDFTPADPRRIGEEDRARLQQALGKLLSRSNPLRIDGVAPIPRLDRVEFLRYASAGMEAIPPEQPLDAATAVVGAILVYLTEKPATALELKWNLFGPDAGREQETRSVSLQYGKETFDTYVTAEDPIFRWSAEEAFESPADPVETPAAATSDNKPAPEQAMQTALPALLHNVYRAFQVAEEEAAYDRLALSLEGDILDEIYLRQRRSLLQRERGLGGEGRVERIETLESRVESMDPDSGACIVAVRWIAHGTISHWGHSHPRSNVYAARLNLRPTTGGQWKITGMEFTEGKSAEAS